MFFPFSEFFFLCVMGPAMPPKKKTIKSQGTFGNVLISSDLPKFISADLLGWHHNHDSILPCKIVTPTIRTVKQRVAVPAVQLKSRDPLAPTNKVWMTMDLRWGCSIWDDLESVYFRFCIIYMYYLHNLSWLLLLYIIVLSVLFVIVWLWVFFF